MQHPAIHATRFTDLAALMPGDAALTFVPLDKDLQSVCFAPRGMRFKAVSQSRQQQQQPQPQQCGKFGLLATTCSPDFYYFEIFKDTGSMQVCPSNVKLLGPVASGREVGPRRSGWMLLLKMLSGPGPRHPAPPLTAVLVTVVVFGRWNRHRKPEQTPEPEQTHVNHRKGGRGRRRVSLQ